MLKCQACTQATLTSSAFRRWTGELRESPENMHRKIWEWDYIAQALHERGMLAPRRRGLGFAVGREPLAALFASYGCDVVATDADSAEALRSGWAQSGQHAASAADLNARGICPADVFARAVTFRAVDMTRIPADLTGFDFVWSSCAIEHLGTIALGRRFMTEMMRCLKPGGVAVHTTEFNVSSNADTIEAGHDVIFRKRDLVEMAAELLALGYEVRPFDFSVGNHPIDQFVDQPPYKGQPHLKLRLGPFVSTSFGLIVGRPDDQEGC